MEELMSMATTDGSHSIRVQVHEAVDAYRRATGDSSRIAEDFIERVVRGVIGLILEELSLELTEAAALDELASRDRSDDGHIADYDVHWRIALEVASAMVSGSHGRPAMEGTAARLDYLRHAIEVAS